MKARCRTFAAVIDTDHDDDTAWTTSLKARGSTDAAVIGNDTEHDPGAPEVSSLKARGRTSAAVIDTDTEHDDGTGPFAPVNSTRASGVPSARTTRTRARLDA